MANIKLQKPQIGATNWGDSVNNNFAKIEKFLNSTSAEMSSLQQKVYAMRQLVLGGAIYIDETHFEEDPKTKFQTLTLKIRPFSATGKYQTKEEVPEEEINPTDIITIPTNVCFKVINKFEKEEDANSLNPRSVDWAMGDFLVVGELAQTTKYFSRLPISIGMYMVPTLGTNEHEGELVWSPEMAETHPDNVYTKLPVQYAYGTVHNYRIKNGEPIWIGKADPIEDTIPTTGSNGFTFFPDIRFYTYNSSRQNQLQLVQVNYTLSRANDSWYVTCYFDGDDDFVDNDHDTEHYDDNLYMYVTMIANGDIITNVEVLEVVSNNETV